MLSAAQIRLFSSLKSKKYREEHRLFLAEGEKIVLEILKAQSRLFEPECLVALRGFLDEHKSFIIKNVPEYFEADASVISRISSLSTPNQAVLVCRIPSYSFEYKVPEGCNLFYFEELRDPGNLGTIMRTADWFGIDHILCSTGSVDVYNPKVVQSTMGAICRVKVSYADPELFVKESERLSLPLTGTVLDGENLYTSELPESGVYIFGNESKGISELFHRHLSARVTIPSGNNRGERSESLNVATAAALVMAELQRRSLAYSK